jgi:formylmethanofuran dehydrogenase subunit E
MPTISFDEAQRACLSVAAAIDAQGGLAALAETEVGPYLEPLGQLHRVLCPRQVLGVRIALLACRSLEVPFPQLDKRTVLLTEIDGCFADGLTVVTGCSLGHRTMRLIDHGKIAATIVDTRSNRAVRIWPRSDVRVAACSYAPGETLRWHAQRLGYARMPDADLLAVREVAVPRELEPLCGQWNARTVCAACGEEVFQDRQLVIDGTDVCRACAIEEDDRAGR